MFPISCDCLVCLNVNVSPPPQICSSYFKTVWGSIHLKVSVDKCFIPLSVSVSIILRILSNVLDFFFFF